MAADGVLVENGPTRGAAEAAATDRPMPPTREPLQPDTPPPPPAAEPRRHLTILFTDLSDSTRLSGAMEIEVYAELTHDIRQAFSAIVRAHGGTVNQFQGDGLQAIFGWPHSTEHDGVRAAEAALAMHERVRALRQRYAADGAGALSVHSGIHAGLALAHAAAEPEAGARIELFGPVPGIAKHLSDIAEADEVLVSEETLGPGSQFFQASEPLLVHVKGSAQPLAVRRLVARTALRTRFEAHTRRGLVPLAGREAEAARIEAALDETARERRVQVLVLAGPPGVGKTRLAEEMLQRAAALGFTALGGWCDEELSAQPLQPVAQMLRAQFALKPGQGAAAAQAVDDALAALDPALAAHRGELLRLLSIAVPGGGAAKVAAASADRAASSSVPSPSPSPAPAGTGQKVAAAGQQRSGPQKTLIAVRDVFAALARRQPLVLFIDDWQWADDATRQVVDVLVGLPGGAPLLLLLTQRGPWLADLQPAAAAAEAITLEPLADAEADRTIARLLPAADPFLAADIRRFSGGNPLFIEELCHFVRAAGASALAEPVQRGSAWLETLIDARVARLAPAQREVLEAAAVIGNVVPGALLARLTGREAGDVVLRSLAEQDFVYPGGDGASPGAALRFKHGITRHVVYSTIGLARKRALHRRVAELIADPAGPGADGTGRIDGSADASEALAYHWAGAGHHETAARHAEAAGDKAMAASALDRARAQFTAAVEMLDRLPSTTERYQTWRSIVRRLGLVAVFDPTPADLAVFARAVVRAREHDDAAGLAYAEYWLAYVTYSLGDARAAVASAERALRAAVEAQAPAPLVIQMQLLHGQALAAASAYPQALARLGEALPPLRALQGSGPPGPGLAFSLACQASVLGDVGEFGAALACFDEALAAVPARGHEVEGSVLCWRSAVRLWQGRWREALDDALAARRVAERVKSLYLMGMSRALAAYAQWRAEAPARSSPEADDDARRDAARELAAALAWLDARGKNLFGSLIHGWLAEVLASEVVGAQGAPGAATPVPPQVRTGVRAGVRAQAARALRRARKSDWLGAAMAMRAAARLAAAEGDTSRALRHLARADAAARVRGAPHEVALNERARAELATTAPSAATPA